MISDRYIFGEAVSHNIAHFKGNQMIVKNPFVSPLYPKYPKDDNEQNRKDNRCIEVVGHILGYIFCYVFVVDRLIIQKLPYSSKLCQSLGYAWNQLTQHLGVIR